MRQSPALVFVAATIAFPGLAANCTDSRDLKLINGKIAAMDRGNTTVSAVTIQNGHEADKMGTIDAGKFGDPVVLTDDYFDPKKVSDQGIKRIHSVLTVVGGKVLHDERKAGQ